MANLSGILIENGEFVGIQLPVSTLPELSVNRIALFESCTHHSDLNISLKVIIRHVYGDGHPNPAYRGRPVIEVQFDQCQIGAISETRFRSYENQFRDIVVERSTRGVYIDPQTGGRRTASGELVDPANTPGAITERMFIQSLTDAHLGAMGLDTTMTSERVNIQMFCFMIGDLDIRGAF